MRLTGTRTAETVSLSCDKLTRLTSEGRHDVCLLAPTNYGRRHTGRCICEERVRLRKRDAPQGAANRTMSVSTTPKNFGVRVSLAGVFSLSS